MAYYYKYSFISPEPLFALVKEELKSYFSTGAVDDLLFPIWTDKCLKKLGRSSFQINEMLLPISNYSARLPDDFYSVREAWLCTSCASSYQLPNAHYHQTITRIDSPDVFCDRCNECENPDIIKAIYKTTSTVIAEYQRSYLLKPGNVTVRNQECSLDCANIGSSGPESFDIRDNKLVVTFEEGTVNMLYYSTERDDNGNQLIPDNFRIK
jgi:hypothetical protein